jgi:hypothetical protein
MEEVPEAILKKLAHYYYLHKKTAPPPGEEIPLWVRNINTMDKTELEYETRDTIRACRELKKKLNLLEYEGERVIPIKSKREKLIQDLGGEWTYMSYYLYTLFVRSGVKVSEQEFDEFVKEETGNRGFITNLSKR